MSENLNFPFYDEKLNIIYDTYRGENILNEIMHLIDEALSEPYTIYTYRYFIRNWPDACIVAYSADDISSVIPLSKEKSFRSYIPFDDKEKFEKLENKRIIGVIVCKGSELESNDVSGYIAMLTVINEFRKKGIGSNLIKCAISQLIKDGCLEIKLEAETSNEKAIRLYTNLGFLINERLPNYYCHGQDAFALSYQIETGIDSIIQCEASKQ
ncbi:hypothetical protein SNEBB_005252 [Seison nebaliae]|nr:hypothetical protein SNEBB_005252 [Seison nebaliae]